MIIDVNNGKIINSKEVYLHDDFLDDMRFNFLEKKLHLSVLYFRDRSYRYSVDFLNVIGFEMSSCDFFVESLRILGFEYVPQESQVLVPRLFNKKQEGGESFSFCKMKSRENYLETLMTFISGDQLRIACENIIYLKREIMLGY